MNSLSLSSFAAWLCGAAIEPRAAGQRLRAQAQVSASATMLRLRDRRELWACWAYALPGFEHPTRAPEFIQAVLDQLPPKSEVTVALHTRPEPAFGRRVPQTFSLKTYIEPLPAPAGNLISRHSYLFIRVPIARRDECDALRDAMTCGAGLAHGIRMHPLTVAEAVGLHEPWLAAARSEKDLSGVTHLQLLPLPFALTPSLSPIFENPPPFETWTYAHLALPARSEAQMDLLRLRKRPFVDTSEFERLYAGSLRGDMLVRVHQGLLARCPPSTQHLLEAVGWDLHRRWIPSRLSPASSRDILQALPWALTPSEARWRSRQHRQELALITERACSLPLKQSQLAHQATLDKGLPVRTNHAERASLDLHATDNGNFNALVLGWVGSGCTFASNALLACHLEEGGHAWAIRSQGAPVFDDVQGVTPVALTPIQPISLNPFSLLRESADFHDALGVLIAWLESLAGPGPDWLRSHMTEAVTRAWTLAGPNASLWTVLQELDRMDPASQSLATALRNSASLVDPAWFSGPCPLNREAAYLSFDLSGLYADSQAQALVASTLLALHSVALTSQSRSVRKMLVVDKAEVLGPNCATLLSAVQRRARPNYCANVITSAPFSPEPGQQTAVEHALQQYSDQLLVLPGSHAYMLPWLKLAAPEPLAQSLFTQLEVSRKRSRFLWVRPEGRELCELIADPLVPVALAPSIVEEQAYQKHRNLGLDAFAALAACQARSAPDK